MTPLEKVLFHLGDHVVAHRGKEVDCRCPAHDDRRASLGITVSPGGSVLVKCQAGCSTQAVLAAIGLELKDLYPPKEGSSAEVAKVYDYKDEGGKLVFQVVRMIPKGFMQRKPTKAGGWDWSTKGVKRVIYRLPELVAAATDAPVFVVEGEKSADRVASLGVVVTCSPGGAGKWRDYYSKWLEGRHVVIVPDNDEPGRAHAEQVAKSLYGVAASIKVLELPGLAEKADIWDWLEAGNGRENLTNLASAAPAWGAPEGVSPKLRGEAAVAGASGVLDFLKLSVICASENGSFTLDCGATSRRRAFGRLYQMTYDEVAAFAGDPFIALVAPDQQTADKERKVAFPDFRICVAKAISVAADSNVDYVGDGLWSIRDPSGSRPEPALYLAQDRRFYRIEPHGLELEHTPVVRGTVAEACSTKHRLNLDRLSAELQVCAQPEYRREAYNALESCLSTWKWGHEKTPPLVAGLIYATWLQSMWSWRPLVLLTGESHSGKTEFTELARQLYLNTAMIVASATEAAIRQIVGVSSLPIMLDEFDRAKRAEAILDLLRGSSKNQAYARGTSGHKAVLFQMRHIPWLIGIHASLRGQADENRFVSLELKTSVTDTIRRPSAEEADALGYRILASAIVTARDALKKEMELRDLCQVSLPQTRWAYLYAVPFAARAAVLGQTAQEASKDMDAYLRASVVPELASQDMMTDQEDALDDIMLATVQMPDTAGRRTSTLGDLILNRSNKEVPREYLEQFGVAMPVNMHGVAEVAFHIKQLVGPNGPLTKTDWAGKTALGKVLRRLNGDKLTVVSKPVKFSGALRKCTVFQLKQLQDYFAKTKPETLF